MKYKITLGGDGYNVAINKLSIEVFKKLYELKEEMGELSEEIVKDVLNRQSIFDLLVMDSKVNEFFSEDFVGFDLDNCYLTVKDYNNNKLFQDKKLESHSLIDDGDYTTKSDDPYLLFICEHVKGNFEFNLDLDEDFDISKFLPIIQECPEDIFTIVGLKYNNKELVKEINDGFDGSGGVDIYLSYY
jgi:hypothetical protein